MSESSQEWKVTDVSAVRSVMSMEVEAARKPPQAELSLPNGASQPCSPPQQHHAQVILVLREAKA